VRWIEISTSTELVDCRFRLQSRLQRGQASLHLLFHHLGHERFGNYCLAKGSGPPVPDCLQRVDHPARRRRTAAAIHDLGPADGDRGTLTGILDTLERNGYTQRTQHARDGRMRWVRLTPKGHAVVDALRPRIHRAERRLVTGLNRTEQGVLIDMLGRMQHAASELRF
jgi:hypothetical protein